jgi:hypothetical protein
MFMCFAKRLTSPAKREAVMAGVLVLLCQIKTKFEEKEIFAAD